MVSLLFPHPWLCLYSDETPFSTEAINSWHLLLIPFRSCFHHHGDRSPSLIHQYLTLSLWHTDDFNTSSSAYYKSWFICHLNIYMIFRGYFYWLLSALSLTWKDSLFVSGFLHNVYILQICTLKDQVCLWNCIFDLYFYLNFLCILIKCPRMSHANDACLFLTWLTLFTTCG